MLFLLCSCSILCIFLQSDPFPDSYWCLHVVAWSELRFLPLVVWCSSSLLHVPALTLRHIPAYAPPFKDQTRPGPQELSRRMVASQPNHWSHIALNSKCEGCWRNPTATLLSAPSYCGSLSVAAKAFHLALVSTSSYPEVGGLGTAFEEPLGPPERIS